MAVIVLTLMGPARGHAQTRFGISTNVLYEAALMPNLSVEGTIGHHWSALLEWTSPWWLNDEKERCLEIINGGVEGRYWFKPQDSDGNWAPLQGHFVGLHYNTGFFDVEWQGKGTQDEFFWMTGVTYGYSWILGKQFRLVCSLGLGLFRANNYNHYHQVIHNDERYLLSHERGNYTWYGPTKANVSIVWMPQFKKKGDRQ